MGSPTTLKRMTTQVLIGKKAGKPVVIKVAQGENLKEDFDAIALAGGQGYESIELLDSRMGRRKRKTFEAAKAAKKGKEPKEAAE